MAENSSITDEQFQDRSRNLSRFASVLVALTGTAVLLGWTMQMPFWQTLGGSINVKANTAICLILSGVSLFLLTLRGEDAANRRVGEILAFGVILFGSTTLLEHLTGWNFGIDELLFQERPGSLVTLSPGRMGPPAAFCFTLSGLVLVLQHRRFRSVVIRAFSLVVLTWSALALTGYTYQSEELYGIASLTAIAAPTAGAFFLLSLGLLSVRIGKEVPSVLASRLSGGVMARRLLFAAATIPFLLGWLLLHAQRSHYVDLGFGTALLVLLIIGLLAILIWENAARINSVESQQMEGQRLLVRRERRLQQQRQLLDLSHEPIFAWHFDHGIDAWNRGCEELYGYTREEAVGQNSNELLGTVFPRGREAFLQELRQSGQWSGELRQLTRSGRMVIVESRQQLIESDGQALVLECNRDVTERKRVDEERRQLLRSEQTAREQAEVANRLKDEFLATVSHELRTPLNAILGWLTLLRSGDLNEAETQEATEVIDRNARAQAQLVDDLLDVSRIVSGQVRLEVKPLDLAEVMTSAIEAVKPAALAKRITIASYLGDGSGTVAGDERRLRQVAWNLLSNAVKFTPPEGRVEVTISRRNSRSQVKVRDSGEGISADFLPFVFERFKQADGSKTRRHGGLGLGLAIARQLVEMHGGTLKAESEGLGRGATFTLEIPIVALRATSAEISESEAETSRLPSRGLRRLPRQKLRGIHVLAIDDDGDSRHVLKEVLARMGGHISTVSSVAEARTSLQTLLPDVIICDLGMPDEDGYDFIKWLRTRSLEGGSEIPTIALTGYARRDEQEQAVAAGFNSLSAKPFDPDKLTDAIARLCSPQTTLVKSST